jgi:lipoprotein-anchoring transpeptidase ErfK/SrfK
MRKLIVIAVLILLSLTLVAPVAAQSGGPVHVVQSGENLFRIGLRYGVTVDALMAANGLRDTGHIYAGQRLTIPAGNAVSANPAPAPAGGLHVVRPGENLFRIALRYGTTAQALAAANGIANADHVYTGQRLTIPGGNGASGAPTPATTAPTPASGGSGRWIDVDLSAQRVTAYVGNAPVRSTRVSTGLPATPTPTGQYRIYVKYRAAPMSGPGYHLPNVPYVMYFYRGYGLHGTYWHSNFGQPMSHGCINLPTDEAGWFYTWASVGTLVNIHY